MVKKTLLLLLIILISGLSGILADRYFFPYLAASNFFKRYDWLKKTADNITVINKTEQVYVREETSAAKIANQSSSSVVNIISYRNQETKNNSNDQIYKNGTGIIVTSDGIIMTYGSAIISQNARYKIMADENSLYDADLLGIDSYSNLAFLKVNASNLPAVSFGNSDEFKSGEKIIAIGNSLEKYQNRYTSVLLNDFNHTFNLSGKTLSSSEKLEGVFEANFPSAELYVGGPIVDYSGQVIGITGSLLKDNKTIFFQIPSNKAKVVLDRVINNELEKNAQLGVYYIPITKTYAVAYNSSADRGAVVYSPSGQQGLAVIANSAAARSGLRINDIIVAINGETVSLEKTLPDLLYKYKKSDEIELSVIRNGQEIKMRVSL